MTPQRTQTQSDLYGISAGLDLVSGVFGYLSGLEAASAARSRADMIRREADVNARRYAEQAEAHTAQAKAMFLASGVTLSGSPIDVLDTQARVAKENVDSILMNGAATALDTSQHGIAAEISGRNALVAGFGQAVSALYKGFGPVPKGVSPLG